jgi:hypothetical protein
MLTRKRQRGRPCGSGKDDSAPLAKVADLMVRESSLKATTAMKRVVRGRHDWGATDATLIRRWQGKWKSGREAHLVAAHERVRPKDVAPSATPYSRPAFWEVQHGATMKEIQDRLSGFARF